MKIILTLILMVISTNCHAEPKLSFSNPPEYTVSTVCAEAKYINFDFYSCGNKIPNETKIAVGTVIEKDDIKDLKEHLEKLARYVKTLEYRIDILTPENLK